ncbi:MFS transporter [Streptomyces sp. NRRL F-2664]|uniref:MFS transporter n=1 Tax=Streptomyces sp. NRRL F-2664 TaxID=1463842 RepID=UPI000B1BE785|nr:MFS transporter [Streptomyces sp. NRRL F-2664]
MTTPEAPGPGATTVRPAPDDVRPAGGRPALAGLSLSMLLSALGTGIAPAALPTLADAFSASFGSVQWVVLAHLLTVTALVVGAGRLGDLFGRRRLLLAGLCLFTVASALCAAAPTLWLLVGARAVQGVGAALMMALTMAFVGEAVPKDRTGRAMGLLGTMSAVGTALGPSLGGGLIAAFGWRAVFVAPVPLGVAALVLVRRHLPADGEAAGARRGRFDGAGTLLLSLALAAYALAMTFGRGGFGPFHAALLAAAALGAGLFVRSQARAASPLVPRALLRAPGLRAGLATSALVSTVMMTTLVVGPFQLSRAYGLDPALTGLVLSVGPLVAAVTGVPAGRLADRFGAGRTTVFGLAAMAGGALALSVVPSAAGPVGYVAPLAVLTAGYAVFQTANNTAVMADVPPDRRGVVSGALGLARNLGLVTGASVMGAVFARAAAAGDVAAASPAAVAAGTRTAFAVAAALVVLALAVAVRGRAGSGAARGTGPTPPRDRAAAGRGGRPGTDEKRPAS